MKILLSLASVCLVGACASPPPASPAAAPLTSVRFDAPLNELMSVQTGEPIFVEGEYIAGEYINVPEARSMTIPGAMMIPFPVTVEAGRLEMARISNGWKYYCADPSKASATFPGSGSVVAEGDCIGIRIGLSGGVQQWVVDNSNHNRSNTIWTRGQTEDEVAKYRPAISGKPFSARELTQISFDGLYGGQLHFTWRSVENGSVSTREFTFDYERRPTVIGMLGKQLEVVDADNVRLSYRWKKL